MHYCVICSDEVNAKRWALGYHTCLHCGDKRAKEHKHCIVPLHKSNYVPIYNLNDLVGINSKGGNQRYF
jgi:ribosomal protein L37AE/L43A